MSTSRNLILKCETKLKFCCLIVFDVLKKILCVTNKMTRLVAVASKITLNVIECVNYFVHEIRVNSHKFFIVFVWLNKFCWDFEMRCFTIKNFLKKKLKSSIQSLRIMNTRFVNEISMITKAPLIVMIMWWLISRLFWMRSSIWWIHFLFWMTWLIMFKIMILRLIIKKNWDFRWSKTMMMIRKMFKFFSTMMKKLIFFNNCVLCVWFSNHQFCFFVFCIEFSDF